MTVQNRPLAAVTHDAIQVLSRELGVVDTARFLGQFGAGQGDYTAERDALFGDMTLDDWIEDVRRARTDRGA